MFGIEQAGADELGDCLRAELRPEERAQLAERSDRPVGLIRMPKQGEDSTGVVGKLLQAPIEDGGILQGIDAAIDQLGRATQDLDAALIEAAARSISSAAGH